MADVASSDIPRGPLAEESGERFSLAHAILVLIAAAVSFAVQHAWPVALVGATSLLGYLARGQLDAQRPLRWSLANLVTGVRLALVVALSTTLVPGPRAALVVAVILALDGLDGYLARRHHAATSLGARFDMETDALLVLVAGFVIFLRGHLGVWILTLGLMRYFYVIAMATGTLREAPPSRLGRAVFTVVAGSLVLSLWPAEPVHAPLALVATALLTYSFARSVRWSLG